MKVTDLAKMIDHSILHPTMTDDDLKRECEVAKKYHVASVCVKPYAVKQAADSKRHGCADRLCYRFSCRKFEH